MPSCETGILPPCLKYINGLEDAEGLQILYSFFIYGKSIFSFVKKNQRNIFQGHCTTLHALNSK